MSKQSKKIDSFEVMKALGGLQYLIGLVEDQELKTRLLSRFQIVDEYLMEGYDNPCL
jgi:hypothetical protein